MKPRKKPCPTCPYRRDCPSGVWAEHEYDLLPRYDLDTTGQAEAGAFGVFGCHQGADEVCSGWAAVHGDYECLALRLAVSLDPDVDVEAVLAYTTDVPLWGSGAEAAEHGKRELLEPGPEARAAVAKIATVRALRGQPIDYAEEA